MVSNNTVRDNGTDSFDTTDGIRINVSSTGNTIRANHLKRNVTHDCHDNTGVSPALVLNTWTDNYAETSFPAGLCDKHEAGDDTENAQTSTAYGWDESYPWYADYGEASELDWTGAYADFDTTSLLQLVRALRTGGVRGATLSPNR